MSCPSLAVVSSCKLIISNPLMASHKHVLHPWPHYLCWFLSFSVTIRPLHLCPLSNPGFTFTLHCCCLSESALSSISLPRQHCSFSSHPCFFFDLQCHDFFRQLIFKPWRNSWERVCAATKSSIKSYLSLSCILIFLPVSKRGKTAICNYIFFFLLGNSLGLFLNYSFPIHFALLLSKCHIYLLHICSSSSEPAFLILPHLYPPSSFDIMRRYTL